MGDDMNSDFFGYYLFPFLMSAGIILLNEMGDKSQLLAMAFASRIKMRKVFFGIILAVLSLNALAVAVGSLLASIPGWEKWIQLISSLLFLFFGLWTLKGEKDEKESSTDKKSSMGEIGIVFASFFFSEMGDKTQLVTISLAARYPDVPVLILLGTSLGMVLADGIGIFAGTVLHKKLPENALKIISASLFVFFGISGLWKSLIGSFAVAFRTTFLITLAVGLMTVSIGYFLVSKKK
jgi:putative Ca2+/H+ antiporter (TMEM165/GDT1 family)